MVFFTCQGCGESLKKMFVQKHRFKCHRSSVVTCVDCGKDFHNTAYEFHYQCITENEKYGGKNFQQSAAKGDLKQQEWMTQFRKAVESLDPSDRALRSLFDRLQYHNNIPRKESKFAAFVSSCLRVSNPNLISRAWKVISAAAKKTDQNGNDAANASKNSKSSTPSTIHSPNKEIDDEPKAKKRKIDDFTEPEQNGHKTKKAKKSIDHDHDHDTPNDEQKFKWRKVIKKMLKSSDDKQMKMKQLRKLVVQEYKLARPDDERSKADFKDLFSKKLLLCGANVVVDGKVVRWCDTE